MGVGRLSGGFWGECLEGVGMLPGCFGEDVWNVWGG